MLGYRRAVVILLTLLELGATSVVRTAAAAQAGRCRDSYAQRIAVATPKVAAVLEGIRARSPNATVLLVGYLRILPPEIGCYPDFPIARGDVPYVDGLEQQLTTMLADQAFHHGAEFVDAYTHALGHDVCQLPEEKWVEGTTPTRPAYPVHPNASGMQAVATVALDKLSDRAEATIPR
ncbi:MAG: GDSL-type esterase/lipase family protein [Pseudonocardiaceae bacterium]